MNDNGAAEVVAYRVLQVIEQTCGDPCGKERRDRVTDELRPIGLGAAEGKFVGEGLEACALADRQGPVFAGMQEVPDRASRDGLRRLIGRKRRTPAGAAPAFRRRAVHHAAEGPPPIAFVPEFRGQVTHALPRREKLRSGQVDPRERPGNVIGKNVSDAHSDAKGKSANALPRDAVRGSVRPAIAPALRARCGSVGETTDSTPTRRPPAPACDVEARHSSQR